MYEFLKLTGIVIALACLFSVRPVHADGTVATTSTTGAVWTGGYGTFNTLGGYCKAFLQGQMDSNNNYYGAGSLTNVYISDDGVSMCTYTYSWYGAPPSTTTVSIFSSQGSITGCPSHSTGNASPPSVCTCDSGYQPDSGSVSCVVVSCPATGTPVSAGFYDLGTIDTASMNPVACHSGCSVEFVGSASASYQQTVDGVKHFYALGQYVNLSTINNGACSTGAGAMVSDSSALSALPAASCGTNQGVLTSSSGAVTCFNQMTGATSSGTSASQVAATSAANSAAAAAAGAAGAAAGTAAATAAGATGGTAVTMGQQAAANAAAETAAKDSECALHPDRLGCVSLGDVPVADAISSVQVTASASPVSFATAAGCPAPLTYSFHGTTYNISYQPACDFFDYLRPVVLMIAAATSAIILMGVFN